MQYPETLTPSDQEVIFLPSGKDVRVPKTSPLFNAWTGEPISDRYGNKPLLNFKGQPVFAELAILVALQSDGWQGVWVDTFRRKYRTSCDPLNEIMLPSRQLKLLNRIYQHAGSRSGCWDVFCWKEEMYLFAESKRHKHDSIRDTQRKWLDSALAEGVPMTSFLIVEWTMR
jgi:hypothetical protein